MATSPITEAIIAEANEKANQPYSRTRKIKGFIRNKVHGGARTAFGGSNDAASRAKVVGRNAVRVAPKALAAAGKQIPVVGSYAGAIIKSGGQLVADKVVAKIDKERVSELRSKETSGALSVKEMTEMMQKSGEVKVGKDIVDKMHDAVRKVDQAYAASRDAIMKANECDSIYTAAKNYAYLKYRVVRLQYYLETMRSHIDEVSEMNERYGAQIVGFEFDLVDMMDKFFASADADYHSVNCRKKDHCYFHQHGIV